MGDYYLDAQEKVKLFEKAFQNANLPVEYANSPTELITLEAGLSEEQAYAIHDALNFLDSEGLLEERLMVELAIKHNFYQLEGKTRRQSNYLSVVHTLGSAADMLQSIVRPEPSFPGEYYQTLLDFSQLIKTAIEHDTIEDGKDLADPWDMKSRMLNFRGIYKQFENTLREADIVSNPEKFSQANNKFISNVENMTIGRGQYWYLYMDERLFGGEAQNDLAESFSGKKAAVDFAHFSSENMSKSPNQVVKRIIPKIYESINNVNTTRQDISLMLFSEDIPESDKALLRKARDAFSFDEIDRYYAKLQDINQEAANGLQKELSHNAQNYTRAMSKHVKYLPAANRLVHTLKPFWLINSFRQYLAELPEGAVTDYLRHQGLRSTIYAAKEINRKSRLEKKEGVVYEGVPVSVIKQTNMEIKEYFSLPQSSRITGPAETSRLPSHLRRYDSLSHLTMKAAVDGVAEEFRNPVDRFKIYETLEFVTDKFIDDQSKIDSFSPPSELYFIQGNLPTSADR